MTPLRKKILIVFISMNKTNNIMNEFTIEKEGKVYDKCILCGDITAYTTDTHIDYRAGYIEGAGQLCHSCYMKGSPESRELLSIPIQLIKDNPNDMELGKKIRELYFEHI